MCCRDPHTAGRVRGIQADADRLHEVFHRDYLHQLPQVEAALGKQTSALLRQLSTACLNADQLEEATTQPIEEHPDAPIIRSFPGLGSLTGARVLAEIGDDRTRFANAGSLKAYAGSAPVTRASGKSCVVMSRRIKNQRLAAVGYVWAFVSLTKSPGARAHYDRRRKPATATSPHRGICSTASWACSSTASSTASHTTRQRPFRTNHRKIKPPQRLDAYARGMSCPLVLAVASARTAPTHPRHADAFQDGHELRAVSSLACCDQQRQWSLVLVAGQSQAR